MARQSCAVVPRWLPRLGSVTARQSSSERQPNYVALNRARHLCSAGRPSRWALAHISSLWSPYVIGLTIYIYGRPMQHISDLHSKFALRPHHVWKYGRHPILGEEIKKEEERRNSMKIYMVCSITQGDHKQRNGR